MEPDTTEIRCPSGLSGRIRKLSAGDFHHLLIDDPEDATPDQFADLATRIWIETTNPGPYRDLDNGKPRWRSEGLVGDRTAALLKSRVFTSGGKRPIEPQCPRCKEWWQGIFDYGAIPMRDWPDADVPEPAASTTDLFSPEHKAWIARKRFAAGEPCCTPMPDGAIHWSLLTGSLLAESHPKFAAQFGETLVTEVASRVVSIEGLDLDQFKRDEEKRAAIFEWINRYDEETFWTLFNDIQDHECGPEPDVLMRCGAPNMCTKEFAYDVDVMGFIVPSPPKRSLRLRAGTRSRQI